ncbi:hypothetical protein [Streptodolium elevatio]
MPSELDEATAASLFASAQRLLAAGAPVLEGSYNRNVRVDHPDLGAVLVRMPKRSALPANLRTWWEPAILRAVQRTVDVPALLYATPGFARRDGDFQIHQFRDMTALPRVPTPVPDFLVERDIPRFFRALADVTDLPAVPHGRPTGTDAQAYADLQNAFLDGLWQRVHAAWPELYERLGFPRSPTAPAHRALDGVHPVPLAPIHPDLWRGNMHLSGGSTVFIDHEYLTFGDPRHALAYTLDESGYTRGQAKRLTENTTAALQLPTKGLSNALQGWTTWAHIQTALRSPARAAANLQSMTGEQAQSFLANTTWLRGVVDRIATTHWGRPALTHEQVSDALASTLPTSAKQHTRNAHTATPAIRPSPARSKPTDAATERAPLPAAPRRSRPEPNLAPWPADANTAVLPECVAMGMRPLRRLDTKAALSRTVVNTTHHDTLALTSGPAFQQSKGLSRKLSRTLGDD